MDQGERPVFKASNRLHLSIKFLMSRLLYFYLVRMNFLLARNFLESCTGPAQWHTVLSLLKVLNHTSCTLPRLPDTCPGLPRTFLTIPEQKSQEVLGQLGTSRDDLPDMTTKVPGPKSQEVLGILGTSWDVLADMTTKVLGPKVSRSPVTTQDIPGCPTRLDYQSPMSNKISQEVLGQLRTSRDVLADMTTKVPDPKVPRSPGTTQDILGCHTY